MTLIGTPRHPPRRADAEAFLARFVAALEARLPWFEAEVVSRGGPSVDGSVGSLDALAGFVAAHMEEDGPAEAPEWFSDAHRRRGWTAYGAALADGLIGLLHRFRALEGVENAVHEDREVFLLRTGRRTDAADLERRLQAVVDQAVAEAGREMQR